MKLVLVAHELPYPPNHGAKVDIWNRIKALHSLGVEIFLVTWQDASDEILAEHISEIEKYVTHMAIYSLRGKLRRLQAMWKYPSHVASRLIENEEYAQLLEKIRSFDADTLLIDHIYPGATGMKIARELGIPVGVRLHNVEHEYMYGQYKLAKGWKDRLSIRFSLLHLRSFEESLISSVNAAFDISINDMQFWKNRGFKNVFWLPPVFPERDEIKQVLLDSEAKLYDVGFLGNLHTPNNVKGVEWFITAVLPEVTKSLPDVTFLVMGSKPNADIMRLCNSNPAVTLIANPEVPANYLKNTKVLINPVRFGSGVNIKSIDMLFVSHPVVSTSAGIKGLVQDFDQAFSVSDDPVQFAKFVVQAIKNPESQTNVEQRKKLRELFSYSSVNIISEKLMSVDNVA
ncbi:hypothetical protein J2Y45_006440 [Dyadobacter sp. BE34]|uniref:Glycosyl transferase group 1 n=1 Tax=Dyadobacter fermentans TaxID=94254 RepID=A0ABU1R747_9BACT|nr:MULTISPECIES: glycosyltransferase [Dyadobacter]MDR6809226.1 hypothetical protein [Dyadobacter fermentans]MDR7046969.1 hypothetical protein [Dyadobacter sp. BE242]MDR7201283.1 hypothetical protein [Dyadobacter sp. BE34]MDR7219243.1 hypothetical protein [Dyadobacter sp. BE31]MDR7264547.1 hypothetical protein [Dyadobacter sp. BE32]